MSSEGDGNSAYAFAYNGDAQVTSVDNNGTPNVPHVVLAQGYDLGGDMTSQAATINGTADFANSFAFNADQAAHHRPAAGRQRRRRHFAQGARLWLQHHRPIFGHDRF